MKRYFLSSICVAAAVASSGALAVKDIDPIATVSESQNLLAVHPSLPVKTVKEFVGKVTPRAMLCHV
jgi:tripartite-type tricarboxylate transporter receptor subunit TctC